MEEKTNVFRNEEDDTFTFRCFCGFESRGWIRKGFAEDRKQQHLAEHEGEAPADPPRNEVKAE
jgi:hypothetical protein